MCICKWGTNLKRLPSLRDPDSFAGRSHLCEHSIEEKNSLPHRNCCRETNPPPGLGSICLPVGCCARPAISTHTPSRYICGISRLLVYPEQLVVPWRPGAMASSIFLFLSTNRGSSEWWHCWYPWQWEGRTESQGSAKWRCCVQGAGSYGFAICMGKKMLRTCVQHWHMSAQ